MNTQVGSLRAIDALLEKYRESHRNHINEWIHIVCVPVIVFTALGLFWSLHPGVALAVAIAALLYYCSLSLPFAAGMLLMSGAMLAILWQIPSAYVLKTCGVVFVLAWIGQFIGHKIEGKKPSFLDDLRFLLIGPLFVLSFLYRRLGLSW
ncbi:Mpo1-like protein [Massilia sp. W12]|uniref:Mpo1 family 2-hydroxy fatty acid dioxygenase n=1 Tax=Massilia sp. W12 TaxID=3126507 RepID=UPI0030CF5AE1